MLRRAIRTRWRKLIAIGQQLGTKAQICIRKSVRHSPAHRTKLAPLLDHSMKQAQAIEHFAPLRIIRWAGLDESVIETSIGTRQVRTQPLWRFVHHLDSGTK